MANIREKIKERLSFLKNKKENPPINIESGTEQKKNMIQNIKEFWQGKKKIFLLAGIAIILLAVGVYAHYEKGIYRI